MQDTWIRSLGQEDSLEKEMATHSSILAWIIPWTEETGRLQSMGSRRIRRDWVTEHECVVEVLWGKQSKERKRWVWGAPFHGEWGKAFLKISQSLKDHGRRKVYGDLKEKYLRHWNNSNSVSLNWECAPTIFFFLRISKEANVGRTQWKVNRKLDWKSV